ncbi:HAMP domain-containing histidine kinase [Leptolyngbya cf. ectocarpi LEGE 11479]|uniref:histidine kinase n=1 Tax=Leptolyngbya cf. ectocarpi LEGE 11479 TaxID=1828722 RepID=A0A928WXE0_LEPEC|nr:HAMP domain-containing sensor histidine kinase [Leptolyngbya ectocarpi]MBE9065205.1 HAMP domain-containing histidine kinase [Leptolyngbya cf. ectocarpi LEGE 11479]
MLNRLKAWWGHYFSVKVLAPNVLSDYRQWRQRFLYQRLRLLIGLFSFVLATITLLEFWLWQVRPDDVGLDNFFVNGVMGLSFVLGLGLQTLPWGKRHQGLIFWLFSAGVTLTLLVAGVMAGNVDDSDVVIWSMVFLSQSTLVPVRWRLHVRSQLTLLIPLTVLVIGAFFTADTVAERSDIMFGTVSAYIYLVWVCIVADLGVFLYERLRYQEFEARQEVQTFLHAVSHDLRNPVTGTQLLVKSLLAQHGQTIPMDRVLLEQMLQSGERQLVLINSLLEAHNNKLKGLMLQRQAVNLYSLIASICQELSPQLAETTITIRNQLSADLPSVAGDNTQLWRVFHNLMINALHHNPPGTVIWVQASVVSSPQPSLRCTVRDNGVGMTAEQCAHLFSLYSQGHRRRHLSVGLGLHIAQQIVHAHGGTIGVDSEVGQGTTFWVTLPLSLHPSST